MTDSGSIPNLSAFKRLRGATIRFVGDSSIRQISVLRELRSLDIGNTAISDNGLECLKDLPNLERLSLAGTTVTDRAFSCVSHFDNLVDLDLTECKRIRGSGISELLRLRRLRALHLRGTDIGDESVQILVQLPALREIDLGNTKVTRAGISQLASMKQLELLTAYGTGITERDVSYLQQMHPGLSIAF